eukprot:6009515-Pyramimonas_sp.AAC.1
MCGGLLNCQDFLPNQRNLFNARSVAILEARLKFLSAASAKGGICLADRCGISSKARLQGRAVLILECAGPGIKS